MECVESFGAVAPARAPCGLQPGQHLAALPNIANLDSRAHYANVEASESKASSWMSDSASLPASGSEPSPSSSPFKGSLAGLDLTSLLPPPQWLFESRPLSFSGPPGRPSFPPPALFAAASSEVAPRFVAQRSPSAPVLASRPPFFPPPRDAPALFKSEALVLPPPRPLAAPQLPMLPMRRAASYGACIRAKREAESEAEAEAGDGLSFLVAACAAMEPSPRGLLAEVPGSLPRPASAGALGRACAEESEPGPSGRGPGRPRAAGTEPAKRARRSREPSRDWDADEAARGPTPGSTRPAPSSPGPRAPPTPAPVPAQSPGRPSSRAIICGPCMNPECEHPHDSPQWRKGPPSHPVLCNACGTRWLRNGNLRPLVPRRGLRYKGRGRGGGSEGAAAAGPATESGRVPNAPASPARARGLAPGPATPPQPARVKAPAEV